MQRPYLVLGALERFPHEPCSLAEIHAGHASEGRAGAASTNAYRG
jgi:hypothetical protein